MTRLEIYGIVALVLALAIGAAYWKGHHSGYVEGKQEIQVLFDAFKNEVTQAGLKAKQDALDKEKKDAAQIADAVSVRNAALTRLRTEQARPRGGFVSGATGSPADSRKICYDRTALDAALRTLDTGVSQLVNQGDIAVIDALTLLKAWPTQQPAK